MPRSIDRSNERTTVALTPIPLSRRLLRRQNLPRKNVRPHPVRRRRPRARPGAPPPPPEPARERELARRRASRSDRSRKNKTASRLTKRNRSLTVKPSVHQVKTATKKANKSVVVCRASASEESSRRAALVTFTAAAAATFAKAASAISIPSQASSGGLGREYGNGQLSSNTTMSGYTMEGTAKGGHSPKVKFGTLAAARAEAEAIAASAPAPKK